MRSIYLAVSLLIAAPVASAQTAAPAEVLLPTEASDDDIIVQALRIPRGKLPVQVQWDYGGMAHHRSRYENIERYIGCAVRLTRPATLRAALDGDINSVDANFAQGVIVSRNEGCASSITAVGGYSVTPVPTTELGRSPFHRGMIADAILRTFAPDAALTRAETSDPEVRARFLAREGRRNRLRWRNELDALRAVSCLVEDQPGYATRIVRARPGSQLEMGLIQAMLIEGRACIGSARRVTIEPLTLRAYLTDAYYRWVVAARDVDTLIADRAS